VQVASANPAPSGAPTMAPTGSTATPAPTLNPADSAVIVLDDLPATPAEPATPAKPESGSGVTSAPPSAPRSPVVSTPVAKPYQPSSSGPVAPKKPGSRKDLYKPF
jgi:hypothetical protein